MNFAQKLDAAISKNNSLLCVNLDPVVDNLFDFNKKIIDATFDLVCAYKPNSAFYEAMGDKGIVQLKQTVDYIHEKAHSVPVILDAKRGDIGNSNNGYAKYAFDYLDADALTVQPYMGGTSLIPFFENEEKGFFVLCKTSNKGAGEFQELEVNGLPMYQYVASQVVKNWNYNHNVMLVMGATYPQDLKKVREIVGDMTILVPGIGAQGGDLGKTLQTGLTANKKGLIIAVGRSIINAENPRTEAEKVRDQINEYRN